MRKNISVIICTHNPREDYLRRVLQALDRQTLTKDQWELLLIDNASAEPLSGRYDLSWHPQARHVREQELGLTPARLRGIREACADLLVFVDDDNVLAPDYLDQALKIANEKPWVGAFGGNIEPEFECEPDSSLGSLVDWVGVVRVKSEKWALGTAAAAQQYCPIGAGMVIRGCVALRYAQLLDSDPNRKKLDRKGAALLCHGDTDMALNACDLGMAVGFFPKLHLLHLIPSRRLKLEYLLKLVEGYAHSQVVFRYLWEGELPQRSNHTILPQSRSQKIFNAYTRLRSRNQKPQPETVEEMKNKAYSCGTDSGIEWVDKNIKHQIEIK